MKLVFADAYYFFGLLSPRDSAHASCVEYSDQYDPGLISTAWVFTELADGIGRTEKRQVVKRFLDAFEKQERNIFVPAIDDLYRSGLELFDNRPDKSWSLTDCISFVVMEQYGVSEALTADQHFEQAGFKALLA